MRQNSNTLFDAGFHEAAGLDHGLVSCLSSNQVTEEQEQQRSPRIAPVLAPLLRRRKLNLVLAVAGTGQILATMFHAPAITCPVMQLFKVPCPGCGLSRACADLLHGRWWHMAQMHAFAPAFVLAIGLFWISGLMGSSAREGFVSAVERLERRTALPTLLLVGLVLYWLVRLVYSPVDFLRLVAF